MSAIDVAPAAMTPSVAATSLLGFVTLGGVLLRTNARMPPSIVFVAVSEIDMFDSATFIVLSGLRMECSTLLENVMPDFGLLLLRSPVPSDLVALRSIEG